MKLGRKAIHLRTGDRGTDGAISAWLERHGIEVIACADAFEACTFALTHSAATPELALIGADWLAPDELAISGYFRETWPAVTIVIYGSAAATASIEDGSLTHVLRSPAAVRRMLAAAPDALLGESRGALRTPATLDDWRTRFDVPGLETSAADAEVLLPQPVVRTRDREAPDVDLAPHVSGQPPETAAGSPVPASPPILTREELAALLDDEEN